MQQGILVAEGERERERHTHTHTHTQRREGYGKLQKRHRVESKRVVRMVGGWVRPCVTIKSGGSDKIHHYTAPSNGGRPICCNSF
jgi:hypothetical protein